MMDIVWAFPHKLIGIIAIIPCLLLGFGFMFAITNIGEKPISSIIFTLLGLVMAGGTIFEWQYEVQTDRYAQNLQMIAQANYDCIAKKKKIDKNELPVTDAVIAEMDKCQKSMNAQKKYPILRAYMWKNDIPLDLNTVKG